MDNQIQIQKLKKITDLIVFANVTNCGVNSELILETIKSSEESFNYDFDTYCDNVLEIIIKEFYRAG